jgi:hypothetical protein
MADVADVADAIEGQRRSRPQHACADFKPLAREQFESWIVAIRKMVPRMTRNNLGTTLSPPREREDDTARLQRIGFVRARESISNATLTVSEQTYVVRQKPTS